MLCRCYTLVRDFLVFDDLPFIEPAEAGALHRRNVYEHVLAAALRLDEAVTLGRIEPFHGTCSHLSLLQSSITLVLYCTGQIKMGRLRRSVHSIPQPIYDRRA